MGHKFDPAQFYQNLLFKNIRFYFGVIFLEKSKKLHHLYLGEGHVLVHLLRSPVILTRLPNLPQLSFLINTCFRGNPWESINTKVLCELLYKCEEMIFCTSIESLLFQDYSIGKIRSLLYAVLCLLIFSSFLIKILKKIIACLPRGIGKTWPEFPLTMTKSSPGSLIHM